MDNKSVLTERVYAPNIAQHRFVQTIDRPKKEFLPMSKSLHCIALSAVLPLMFGCQKLPATVSPTTPPILSARELFELRSQCGAYIESWKQITGEWGAHYDEAQNRCYLENTVNGLEIKLYDPQENRLLTSCQRLSPATKEWVCQINGHGVTSDEGVKFIAKAMGRLSQ